MQTLTHRAAHATWWSAWEIIARYGVQFAVMVVLARILTPEDFGLVAMLLVFTSVGALLADSGFGTALIQSQSSSDDDASTVFLFSTSISVSVAVILWLAAPLIAHFYAQPALVALTRTMVLVLPLGSLASVPDALLTQQLNFKARARAEIIASLVSAVVALVIAWRGFGVWSLVWQSIILIGVRALLVWLYSGWRPRGRFRRKSFRKLFGFGGYMLLSNLLNTISIRLQSLLLGKMFDSQTLGYYTVAQNTQQAPASFMSSLLNRVGLPVFSTVADQPAKLLGALRLSLRVIIFAFVPCMVGIAVIARPLTIMLYGARWAPAAPILSILAVSATFWPLHVLNLAAISAQGRSDLIFRLEVIKRIISIGLIVACSPDGPIAIACAVLMSSLFAVAINTWYSKKLLGYGALAQLQDQYGTLVLASLAAISGWAVLHWMAPGTAAMVIAIVAAVATYLAGATLGRHSALWDILGLIRILRSSKTSLKEKP